MYTSASLPPVGAQILPAARFRLRIRELLAANHQGSSPGAAAPPPSAPRHSASFPRVGCGLNSSALTPEQPHKQRSRNPSDQPWMADFLLYTSMDRCGSEGKACAPSPLESPDSLFVTWRVLNFLCYTGSLFCTVSEGHMNPGSCVFIMHSRLVRTYYPMGIYENGKYQSVQ